MSKKRKLNDKLLAEHKKEAKQIADIVKDPDCRDIIVMRIDLATTEQEFNEALAEMYRCIRSEQLLAKYEEEEKWLATVVSDPEFREIILKRICSTDDWSRAR